MSLFRRLWYILNRRERVEGAVLLCGMGLGALFEACSIGLVVPFITALNDPERVMANPTFHKLFAALAIEAPNDALIAVGLGLVAAFVIKSGYLVLLYSWLFRYAAENRIRLAGRLLAGYLDAPYTFHLQRNSAELVRATTGTVQGFTGGFLVNLLTVAGELLVLAALVALLMLVAPLASLGALVVLGVPTVLIYWLTHRRLKAAGRASETGLAAMIQWTEQAIGGAKETLVTGRRAFFLERHDRHTRAFAQALRSFMLLSAVPRLLIDTIAIAAMVAIAVVILLHGQSLQAIQPALGMFAVAAMRLIPSTSRISNGLAQLRFHHASVEVLYQELRATEATAGSRVGFERGIEHLATARPFARSLVLERVSYSYPAAARPSLDDVSFEIGKGEWAGIIGATGAGKTTLLDLMLGVLTPTAGRILIDGSELSDDVAGWQRNIGYVPQDVYVMDDTVRRNVAFGVPDEAVRDEQVWLALRAAQMEWQVRALDGGLDAVIGERGERLSGGERQRLGIARALYHDPPVLIVDEGTAHLDSATEAAIEQALARLRGQKTIIVVAHRPALVRNCDRVHLLLDGRLAASGGYAELMAKDAALRQLAAS